MIEKWELVDAQGNLQGPYTEKQMCTFLEQGYVVAKTPVRECGAHSFVMLGSLPAGLFASETISEELYDACRHDDRKRAVELLRLGADPNWSSMNLVSCLAVAAGIDSKPICLALLTFGARANQSDIWQSTPLHQAASHDSKCIEVLVRLGKANIEATDIDGRTPAHIAANAGSVTALHALIALGADLKVRDRRNRTPADYAAAHPDKTTRRALSQVLSNEME